MKREISITPQNALILVMDETIGVIPDSMNGRLVAATVSCVAIGTISEANGQCLITLADKANSESLDSKWPLIFDGVLDTPSKEISVCSVIGERLIGLHVNEPRTSVKIWANDQREPSEIRIVVGPKKRSDN